MRKNKNFKKLMIFAIAAVMCLSAVTIVANAAFVEVGTGTSASWYPTYGYYDYSYHGCIYKASDIGTSMDINKISYDIQDYSGYTNTEYTIYNQQIYMTHTTLTTFPDATPFDPGTMTLVYDGDVHWSGIGWNDITLDTSFSYDGVDNLIVYWENHDGDYDTGDPDFYYTYTSYTAKYGYSDGSFPTSGYRSGYQPNIRLHFPTAHDVAVTDIVTPENIEGYGSIPVHIEVKNNGLNTETFPVNVKILSPPVTLLQEGFESCYTPVDIRPNPPLGWLVKDVNLDGYFSGVYAYDMWGSYYSSSYANTGLVSMRCEDGTYGGGTADDWLFTPGVALTGGQNYVLDFYYATSSSSTTYHNCMEVYICNAQDDSAIISPWLWQEIDFAQYYYNDYGFASVPFTGPGTGTYYLAWHVFSSDTDADIFVDDVHLYIPGSTIYDQTVTMTNLGVGSTSEANLPNWVVASPGMYTVVADAQLGTDQYLPDNIMTQMTQVGLVDGALASIDIPHPLMGPAPFDPKATVTNVGAMDFNAATVGLLPVHATILDPSGGTGLCFAEEFETPPSLFEFEGDVEVEADPDGKPIDKHGELYKTIGTITWPDDEPQFGDTDEWTILNPDNNGALWHWTDYRSSPTSPTHSMYHGDENTKVYLPDSVDILISPKIHVGTGGGSFSFDIYNDVEGGPWDYVVFGASPDGMSWGWWFGSSWWMTWYGYSGIPIDPSEVDANGDCYVAFAFFSDGSFEYEGVYIDNVQVQGSPYLYDETVYVSLPSMASTQVTFPTFTPLAGYNDYVLDVCCEHPKDSVPANDCGGLAFNTNAPVWNARTGFGYATIQAAIDSIDTIDGDTIVANDGNFYEDINIWKQITVTGLNPPTSGTSYLFGTVDITMDNSIFENFYVHPLTLFTADQAAIAIYANHVIVRDNIVEIEGFTSGTIKGIHAYATPSDFKQDIEISNNIVRNVKNAPGTGVVTHYFNDFESNNGGWVPTATWDPVGDWEWSNTYNVGCYVGGEQPPPTAYSGTGLWGTKLCDDYTNSGGETLLSQNFDFTGLNDAHLSFWEWSDLFGSWDYGEVLVNGVQEYYIDSYPGTAWQYVDLNLAAYDGMASVDIVFSMHASTVVEYAGWYIDDVAITGTGTASIGGAVGIMVQGSVWDVDVLGNEVHDIHSGGWSYGIENTPTALDPVTQTFQDTLDFYEDFTGVPSGGLPTGWTKDPSTTNWGVDTASSNAGGVTPELEFYYSPSATNEFYVMTPEIDTAGFSTLTLDFLHYVSHYTTPYDLRVVALAGGTEYLIDEWLSPTGWPSTAESYTLTAAHGVGASDFQIAWVFDGYSWNINWWDIDNVHLYGSYSYTKTVYPWPENVNIEENHIYRISLGAGYPWPDPPVYDGVMLTNNYAVLPTGGPTPADASEVMVYHNWFDPDCFYPTLAILNMDLMHCLMAGNNYFGYPDGPGSFDPFGVNLVYDCLNGQPANGGGSQIVLYGPVHFYPFLGLKAIITAPMSTVVYADTNEPIVFDGSTSWAKDFTGVMAPVEFMWKFDDGHYSFEPTINHAYTAPGTYDGYLRVKMLGIPEFGIPPLYDWAYFTIVVSSPGAPLGADAGGGSLSHYEVSNGKEITLSGLASGGTPPYTYSWDLGDGRIVDGQNPTVIYWLDEENPVTTEYTITLTVVDSNYDVATATATVTVLEPDELVVSINAPANAQAGQSITLTSTVTGGTLPYTYEWNFDDGTTSNMQKPTHIYETAGTYEVTLTVTDSVGAIDTATKTIEITAEESNPAEIKQVKGGLGVKATIAAGDSDCDWTINVDGKYVFSGGEASGTIQAGTEQTVQLPFTFALGKVTVTVTANEIQEQYTAFALGPLFLNLK